MLWNNIWIYYFLPFSVFSLIEVKFTYIKLTIFKVYDSEAFSTFTMLCNHHLYQVLKHFHHPKRTPCTHSFFPPTTGNYQFAFRFYGVTCSGRFM